MSPQGFYAIDFAARPSVKAAKLSHVCAAVAALACVAAWPGHVAAQRADDVWVPLGCRDIGFQVDRDAIDLRRSEFGVRAIRLKVGGASVHLLDLIVVYVGGEPERLEVRREIAPGEQSKSFDLRGRDRSIQRIEMVYRTRPGFAERAAVCAEALQDADRRAGGAGDIGRVGDSRGPVMSQGQPQTRYAAPPARAPAEKSQPQAPTAAPQSPGAQTSAKPTFRGARPAQQQPWDVVPVYYGTDRTAQPEPARASYSSDRGKRLELGRALVTVPKSHQVPQVERPWVYHLPFTSIVLFREREDPRIHFTLKEVQALTKEQLLALVRERLTASKEYKDQALVFVHGFNTTFDNALFRTAQIAYDLKFDGAPFVYSWPSQGAVGFQNYSYDRESTGQAEPYFRQFLEMVTRQTGAKSVSVIGHSMGNQLLMSTLRDIKRSAPTGVTINQVVLAAPDVDRDSFEFLAREIEGVSTGITLLAASNDRALEISRRFWGGIPRAGDVPLSGPIVLPGIDTIDISATSTEVFSINHNGYAEQPTLLSDMQILIRSGTRPPARRVPSLEVVKTDRGEYWRYPRGK